MVREVAGSARETGLPTPRPGAFLARAGGVLVAAALVLGLVPAPAASQAPETWVTGWGGVYMDPGTVRDDESGTEWDFGTSIAFGAGIQHLFGNTLNAGLEVGYSPIKYEARDLDTDDLVADGSGHLLTTMAVGRLGTGGGGGFFTYLTGGVGAMTYGLPELDRWDTDLALRAGGGLQYGASERWALFVEWNRWWVFHQSEGVDDNTVRHSHLEIGVRYGL